MRAVALPGNGGRFSITARSDLVAACQVQMVSSSAGNQLRLRFLSFHVSWLTRDPLTK